jgi:hypothetical protein
MKLIIAGSRTIDDYELVVDRLKMLGFNGNSVSEVVSGTAQGVDTLGEAWAHEQGIPVVRFPAQWSVHGRAAGHIRNAEMAEYADRALVIHTGSNGSLDMINAMKRLSKPVYSYRTMNDEARTNTYKAFRAVRDL